MHDHARVRRASATTRGTRSRSPTDEPPVNDDRVEPLEHRGQRRAQRLGLVARSAARARRARPSRAARPRSRSGSSRAPGRARVRAPASTSSSPVDSIAEARPREDRHRDVARGSRARPAPDRRCAARRARTRSPARMSDPAGVSASPAVHRRRRRDRAAVFDRVLDRNDRVGAVRQRPAGRDAHRFAGTDGARRRLAHPDLADDPAAARPRPRCERRTRPSSSARARDGRAVRARLWQGFGPSASSSGTVSSPGGAIEARAKYATIACSGASICAATKLRAGRTASESRMVALAFAPPRRPPVEGFPSRRPYGGSPMLDLALLRRDPERVRVATERRGFDTAFVDRVRELDERLRAARTNAEASQGRQERADRARSRSRGPCRRGGPAAPPDRRARRADRRRRARSSRNSSARSPSDWTTSRTCSTRRSPTARRKRTTSSVRTSGAPPRTRFRAEAALGDRRGARDPRHRTRRASSREAASPSCAARARGCRARSSTSPSTARRRSATKRSSPPYLVSRETMWSTGQLSKFSDADVRRRAVRSLS